MTKKRIEVFSAVVFIVCLALFVAASISCTKHHDHHDHPFAPIDHDHPHEHDPVTIIVEVPVLCDTTDIEVAFTGIIDRSSPNVYLLKVSGFPDELIEETETAATPTEKTYNRSYAGFEGGAISFEVISGSRAAAVKVEVTSQICSE